MATDFRSERTDGIKREKLTSRYGAPKGMLANFDWVVFATALALTLFGLLMVSSATYQKQIHLGNDPYYYVKKQAIAAFLGVVCSFGVAVWNYRLHRFGAIYFYAITTFMLMIVASPWGHSAKGIKAWIKIFGIQIQPAEFAKITLVIMLAAHFHEYREEGLGLQALIEALAIAALPMALIMLQPDLGTFLVLAAIVAGILLAARVRWKYMASLVAITLAGVFAVFKLEIIKEYQMKRLTSFIDPAGADPKDIHNVFQAQIAVGSGGIFGKGLWKGTQTSSGFIPENHNDFIYSAIGEQTGLIGCTFVLVLYAILLWRAIVIARQSRDTFGSLIVVGIITILLFHIMISVGMTISVMPVTGIPMPFISYGGTHMLMLWLLVGLLESVRIHRL